MPITFNDVDLKCDRCGSEHRRTRIQQKRTDFGVEVTDMGASLDSCIRRVWMQVGDMLVCSACITTTANAPTPNAT